MSTDDTEFSPREDPPEEPTEPWARANAKPPDWEKIREEVNRRGTEEEVDSESELQQQG